MDLVHQWVVAVGVGWALLLVLGFVAVTLRVRSLLDRVLAVDVLAMCVVAVLALLAIRTQEVGYLDAALALALLTFVGTVAAARFRHRGGPF